MNLECQERGEYIGERGNFLELGIESLDERVFFFHDLKGKLGEKILSLVGSGGESR